LSSGSNQGPGKTLKVNFFFFQVHLDHKKNAKFGKEKGLGKSFSQDVACPKRKISSNFSKLEI